MSIFVRFFFFFFSLPWTKQALFNELTSIEIASQDRNSAKNASLDRKDS